jgi:hypothetical protein
MFLPVPQPNAQEEEEDEEEDDDDEEYNEALEAPVPSTLSNKKRTRDEVTEETDKDAREESEVKKVKA